MRGRIASAAIGASVAKSRASAAAGQQAQAAQAQQQQAQQQIQAQQKQIEALQQPQQPQQEDPMQKLQKYADLKQKGIITEEEFQKLKMDLLSKMWRASNQVTMPGVIYPNINTHSPRCIFFLIIDDNSFFNLIDK